MSKIKKCAVYWSLDEDGYVLRVGKTCQQPPEKRIHQQRNEIYYREAESAFMENELTPADADCLERLMIDEYDPPYNKQRPDPDKCYL